MKEIFFCNLIVEHNKKKLSIKEVVYKESDGYYHNKTALSKYGINEKVKVLNVDIIKSMGFENIDTGYTVVGKSNEKRNETTGAYE